MRPEELSNEFKKVEPDFERLDEGALEQAGAFRGPTPGQSLTNNPDQPREFETPPQFTSIKEAQHALFSDLVKPEVLKGIAEAISKDIPLEVLAKIILMRGYQMGMFNPDMMLLLIEPLLYMLLIIAEKLEMSYRIFEEDDPRTSLNEQEKLEVLQSAETDAKQQTKFGNMRPQQLSPESVDSELREQLENLPIESLLERPQQGTAPQQIQEQSLLAAR
tara:strand:- start:122 stop:778 length:657 start_codon:yes stop_codon:yes gene_type:complete